MTAVGHIDMTDGGAMDVYFNGERMDARDGYQQGLELRHDDEDRVVSVFVAGDEDAGITSVTAEYWDDSDEAFWGDPDGYVEFEHQRDDEDGVFRFESPDGRNWVVEFRSVDTGRDGDD